MAINYGTNIAGASKGGFAILSVEDTVGGAPFSVLDGDVVTGQVTAVAGAVPLTTIQLTALSSILKGLISIGTVAGNQLQYLRKLVGVIPLTTGPTVTLSVAPQGGNVWRLQATLSAAGTAFVYVPNTAAAGPFTGDGASSGSPAPPTGPAGGDLSGTYPNPAVAGIQGTALAGINAANGFLKRNGTNTAWEEAAYGAAANTVCQGNDPRLSDSRPPTGAAGGILGYTGSSYPNPNGLAGNVTNTIPLKSPTGGTLTVALDANAGAGKGLALIAADSTDAVGGQLTIGGGDGVTQGGDVYIRPGEGSAGNPAGSVTIQAGSTPGFRGGIYLNAAENVQVGTQVENTCWIGTYNKDMLINGQLRLGNGGFGISSSPAPIGLPYTAYVPIQNTTGGNILLQNPNIDPGQDGQRVLITMYGGIPGSTMTFTDGQGVKLGAATRAIGNGGVIEFIYSVDIGLWLEIAFRA